MVLYNFGLNLQEFDTQLAYCGYSKMQMRTHYCLFVCLCLTSHRQRGHSETAPPFTVPCEGREAR